MGLSTPWTHCEKANLDPEACGPTTNGAGGEVGPSHPLPRLSLSRCRGIKTVSGLRVVSAPVVHRTCAYDSVKHHDVRNHVHLDLTVQKKLESLARLGSENHGLHSCTVLHVAW